MLSSETEKKFIEFIDIWKNSDLNKLNNILEIKNVRKILTDTRYFGNKNYFNNELSLTQGTLNQLHKFLVSVMGWIHCNPSKEETVALAKEVFIFADEQNDLAVINSKVGMKAFVSYLVEETENDEVIVIHGTKGKGKTYTQNFILNTETKTFLDKGLTWFRIDLTKVLTYQARFDDVLTLKEYLYSQIVYVYFRYGNVDNPADKALGSIHYERLLKEAKEDYEGRYELSDFSNKLIQVQQRILKKYARKDGLNKPLKEKIVTSLAITILKLLEENSYSFLLFIDGIDNVDYIYDNNLEEWISEIYKGGDALKLLPSKLILSCRPETLSFIKQFLSQNNNKKHNGQCSVYIDIHKEFRLDNIELKDIFDNVFQPIKDKDFTNYEVLRKKLHESKFIDKELLENSDLSILEDFSSFGIAFPSYIAIAMNERHNQNLDQKDVIEVVYHGSLRDMLYDIKHAYMYIYHHLAERSKEKQRKNILVTDYINEKKRSRSFLVLSSLSRNGRIYYNDTNVFTPPFLLLHSFNLFNFINLREHLQTKYKDMFLAILILKYLESGKLYFDDIVKKCTDDGFFSKEIITKIERKLLEHGLIELEVHDILGNDYCKLPRQITKRGEYALTVLEDMDILHSFSYDMYFPVVFIKKGIVKAHRNDLSDYASAQIYNVLSILKLLQLCQKKNKIEMFNLYEFFSRKIKNQLIRFSKSMNDKDIECIINNFQNFINEYSSVSKISLYSREELIEQFQSKILSYDEFTDKMKDCGYS